MVTRTKKCEVCGYEMPIWATRCVSCEENKYNEEVKSEEANKRKRNFREYIAAEVTEVKEPIGNLVNPKPSELTIETPKPSAVQVRLEISALYLGGTGADLDRGSKGVLVVNDLGFFFQSKSKAWSVGLTGIRSFQISGAGAFQSGGGWFGGGFGFSGAMQGAAMASMMNLLTTRTHFDCLLRVVYDDLDVTFQILDRTPRQLEIDLTGLKYLVSEQQPAPDQELANAEGIDTLLKLSILFEKGLLSREEFDEQKKIYLKKLQ